MGAVKAAYLAAFDVPVPPSSASDIGDGLEAMVLGVLPPKTILPSEVDAADIADNTKFVVGGGTAGLGVGAYEGWAICNGNNGTRSLGKFLRATTAGIGAGGGSDSSAHTHSEGSLYAGLDVYDGSDRIVADLSSGKTWNSTHQINWANPLAVVTVGAAETGGANVHGATGAASATDNKPAYDDIVYLMKL